MALYGTLGELSDDQLQAALDRFNLGRLETAEAFSVGLFGKNVGLTTDAGRWVLRGHPWPANSDEQFRRERFWASSIRTHCDVPVPWPFHIEADESIFGWPFQLTPWMPGVQERNAVGAAAVGHAAAALRSVTFEHFGEWSPATDAVEPFAETGLESLTKRTESLIDEFARQARPLAHSDLAFVRGLLPDELDAVPSYVHHDLKPGNCVCANGVVSGLFDLGEGLIGDTLENLARATWDLATFDVALVAPFLDAYEDAAGTDVPLDQLRDYVLLDLLGIWEYGTRPDAVWFPEPTFESWVTKFALPVDRALDTRQ